MGNLALKKGWQSPALSWPGTSVTPLCPDPSCCTRCMRMHARRRALGSVCAISQGAWHPLKTTDGAGCYPRPFCPQEEKVCSREQGPVLSCSLKGHASCPFILAGGPKGHMLFFLLRNLFIFRVARRMVYGERSPNQRGQLDGIFSES